MNHRLGLGASLASVLLALSTIACDPSPGEQPDAGQLPDAGALPDAGELPDGGDKPDGGDEPYEPPPELATFTSEAAEAICGALTRCCDDTGAARWFGALVADERLAGFAGRVPPAVALEETACRDVVQEILETAPFADWIALAQVGEVKFDPGAADACVAKLGDVACGRALFDALEDPACFGLGDGDRSMFRRGAGVDDACHAIDSTASGSCDPSVAFCCVGDACDLPTSGAAGTCHVASTAGEDCRVDAAPFQPCAAGLLCAEGVCVAPGAASIPVGEACIDDQRVSLGTCASGRCDVAGSGTCVSLLELGETCTADVECASGACVTGECAGWAACIGELADVHVAISPDSVSLKKGRTQQLTASVEGTSDTRVTWRVREDDGGTVTSDGLYTAPMATGTFHVVATSVVSPSRTAEVAIEVTALELAVSPEDASITSAGTQQFSATIDGAASDEVEWSVKEEDGGSITETGLYTPPVVAAPTTFHVVAATKEDPSVTVEVAVTVSPLLIAVTPATAELDPGAQVDFDATIDGVASDDVEWSVEGGSENGTIDANGLYTAPLVPGTFRVVATSRRDPSRTATAEVTVSLVTVVVAPNSVSLNAGADQQFTATVTGTDVTTVTWAIVDAEGNETTDGGTIDSDGLYTAPVVDGTFYVKATSTADPRRSGLATVIVSPVALTISPESATVTPGGTTTFTATVTGAASEDVVWRVVEETGGSVSQDGEYAAPWVAGTYTVEVSSVLNPEAKASATVTVEPLAVEITTDTSEAIAPGSTLQLAVSVTADRPVSWKVTDADGDELTDGGTIDDDGLYTAPWVGGEYWVHATSVDDPLRTDSVKVTVEMLTLTLSPEDATVPPLEFQQFTATVTGGRTVTWSATDGLIDETGLFLAPEDEGEVTITATSVDDPRVSASVTVVVAAPRYTVSFVAGSPTEQTGTTEGNGDAARFNFPTGIARISATEFVVADEFNSCLRLVTTAGDVSRFSGNCSGSSSGYGTTDGPISSARFKWPNSVVALSENELWVSDQGNNRLRRIRKTDGAWTVDTPTLTFAPSTSISSPSGLAATGDGKLLLANTGRNNVLEIDPTTLQVSLVAGPPDSVSSGRSGNANGACTTEARFGIVRDVAEIGGKLYLSDYTNHCVRLIDPDAEGGCQVSAAAGLCGTIGRADGIGTAARLTQPYGLASGPDGRLYVAEYGGDIISVFDPASGDYARFAGTSEGYANGDPLTEAKFNGPADIAFAPDGSLYITERFGNRVRRLGR